MLQFALSTLSNFKETNHGLVKCIENIRDNDFIESVVKIFQFVLSEEGNNLKVALTSTNEEKLEDIRNALSALLDISIQLRQEADGSYYYDINI
ncbi:MAG TPA: hypothetical protein DIT04_11270 [Dysgonomonas sp.]|nr:hypothetical protein [Dysgonomonas sp.]